MAAYKTMKARYATKCPTCGEQIAEGEPINHQRGLPAVHERCGDPAARAATKPKALTLAGVKPGSVVRMALKNYRLGQDARLVYVSGWGKQASALMQVIPLEGENTGLVRNLLADFECEMVEEGKFNAARINATILAVARGEEVPADDLAEAQRFSVWMDGLMEAAGTLSVNPAPSAS